MAARKTTRKTTAKKAAPKKAVKKAVKKAPAKKAAAKKKVAPKKTAAKKTVVRKAAPKKKAAPKRAAAKKTAVKKAPARKAGPIQDRYSKTQILNEIAANTELSRKEVAAVLEELSGLVERHIKKRGCGEFTLPGLLKVMAVKKPARKARKGVPNPFRPGELMDVAAKPATVVVKVRPLKKLKDFALS